MNTSLNKESKGFTIIEVVLVLAIAGLIFLIVFLALPQLQSSRRDTQRKNDAGRLVAAIENFAGNRSGVYPADQTIDGAWVTANVSGNFEDPSSGTYSYIGMGGYPAMGGLAEGQFLYRLGYACDPAGGAAPVTAGTREFVVMVGLENGEFCQDNQ